MTKRYYSLDVFRGATVALMILVNNPGTWSHIYDPLEHAPWHGVTPTDLVFPFFLFAVGNAMAFVMPRFEAAGDFVFWKKVLKRSLLIFAIGLFLNWSPFVRWDNDHLVFRAWEYTNSNRDLIGVRIPGVLQRIALCYFFASIIAYYLKPRGAFLGGIILLLFYWVLCVIGNPADPYSITGWFGTDIDKAFLGPAHLYRGERVNGQPYIFDPEGLMSTIPAIVQVIFGYLVGDYIIKNEKVKIENTQDPKIELTSISTQINYRVNNLNRILTGLFMASMALLFAGYVWGLVFPLNKKIWTSSYTVYTTGLAISILAVLIYAIEVRSYRGWWSRFFDVFGKNPLFIFFLSGFLPRLQSLIRIPNGFTEAGSPKYLSPFGWFYENICKPIPGPPENGSLLYAIIMILFYWSIVYIMDKKKIYVKV
ncbi:MAG: acyltransferase family protein [Chitinophagaceae bacterium]